VLHARVVRLVREWSFQLLERLGDAILEDLMRDARIARAEIRIEKPGLMDGASPAVRLTTRREA
jgi:dihydroneopterin aldolase